LGAHLNAVTKKLLALGRARGWISAGIRHAAEETDPAVPGLVRSSG
jgi:hypothetical protein